MIDKNITFEKWIKLSPEDQRLIYEAWDRYKGEGEGIVLEACKLFKEAFKEYKEIVNVNHGVYHGGDWVISVSLRVGHNIRIPDMFYGIKVIKLYDGLTEQLKNKLSKKYENNIKKFVESEIEEFRKYFDFKDAPYEKEWLFEFVKMHTGRYKLKNNQQPIDVFNKNLQTIINKKQNTTKNSNNTRTDIEQSK